MPELNRKLVWLMAIRLLVLLSLLLPAFVYLPQGDEAGWLEVVERLLSQTPAESDRSVGPPAPGPARERGRLLQVVVATVSLQTLLYASFLRVLARRPLLHAWIQIAGDLLLITLVIYKFGSATANVSILYFGVIAVASFLLRQRSGLLAAVAAAVLYFTVVQLHHSDSFRSIWSTAGEAERTATSRSADLFSWLEPPPRDRLSGVSVGYKLAVHFIAFFVVASFTTYLSRDQALERKLRQKQLDLDYLQVLHRDVLESISSGLIVTDLSGRINSMNRAAREILGLGDEILGEHILATQLFDRETWRQSTEQSGIGMVRSEVEIHEGDDLRLIGFSLSHLRDAESHLRGFILVFQDLTDWRLLQEKVQMQDRMAALGQMAAGLAHEVGNPLAAITGTAQLLEPKMEDPKISTLLRIMRKESSRLDRTVKSFLQFAKPTDHLPEAFDIAAHLAADVELLRNSDEVGDDHEIEIRLEPESAIIEADVDQISQVFWNLSRNALRSMPDGGRLDLVGRLEGDLYSLEFHDRGRGMSETERAQLFQPFKSFFDRGLGLGMAIVYRIVQEHGGEILVDSVPGRGTSIRITLPRTAPFRSTPIDGQADALADARADATAAASRAVVASTSTSPAGSSATTSLEEVRR